MPLYSTLSAFEIDVSRQCFKQLGKPSVPLIPVMASLNGVEFGVKVAVGQERSKLAVCRQKAFLLSACQEEVWRRFRIRGSDKNERIIVAPTLASCWPKDQVVMTGLLKPFDGECTSGYIDRRTDPSYEDKQIRMAQ